MTKILKRKPLKTEYQEITSFKELLFPGKQEQVKFITTKPHSTILFIDHILNNKDVEKITITSSSVDKKAVSYISEISKNIDINIVSSSGDRKKDVIDSLFNLNESENINVKLDNIHTKIMIIKTKEDYFVLEGSGNISTNAKIEQYSLINDKESYEFHESWINDIFNEKEEETVKENSINSDALLSSVKESLKEIGIKGKTLEMVLYRILDKYEKKTKGAK